MSGRRGQDQDEESPIPGRGVEITELLSDDDMESQIVSGPSETVTEIESHTTVTQKQQQQSIKPDKIMEETEEESDGEVEQHKAIEVEDDESLPNQTPISLDSGDQLEEVEASPNNGHDVVTSELINTSEYGNEIVDDIISEAISRVNYIAPEDEDEVEEQEELEQVAQEQVEQEQEELELESEEMEQLIEQDFDEPVEIQPDYSGNVGGDNDEAVEPEQLDPDSEEPSSKSDPIDEPSLTEDAGASLSVEPAEEETGENEAEPEPTAQKTETSTSGGKKKNRKKKGKKGGGGGGGGGNGN